MDALQLADRLQDTHPDATSTEAAHELRRQYFQVKNLTRVLKEARSELHKAGNDFWMTAHDTIEKYGEQDERN